MNTRPVSYDLLVIGGGVNGAGIARDAAGRGAKVLLVEKDDLAQHTSSASTKLIHGGLRYLEYYEFRLVREALREREVLLSMAPHIIWSLRFVLPYDAGLRPAWLLRLGLFLYDHIGGRKKLAATRRVSLDDATHRGVLKDRLRFGFEYSDCWVEDARLVALNAVDARDRGAQVLTQTECTSLRREGALWHATLRDRSGAERAITARAVANAGGPWVERVAGLAGSATNRAHVRLVKGSHIVVPRLFEGEHCYIFQNGDGRIVFAIPYEHNFTLIGTTDVPMDDPDDLPEIEGKEVEYLCAAINEYIAAPITPDDVRWTYSGVRSLYDDGATDASAVTRDYVLEMDAGAGLAPMISAYGGKITTYRELAEDAVNQLVETGALSGDKWTHGATLPGGDIAGGDFAAFLAQMRARYGWLEEAILLRLCRAYGTRIADIIGNASGPGQLGTHLGGGVYEAELTYLRDVEFAQSGDDVLWRRSKLGLHLDDEAQAAIAEWFTR